MEPVKNTGSLTLLSRDIVTVRQLPISRVEPNTSQPRRHFDQTKLQELANSLLKDGQLQPIGVREVDRNKWEIVFGERRWRAAQLANWETINAIVLHDIDVQRAALIENLQREGLNAAEEAAAVTTMAYLSSPSDTAESLGKSRSYVSDCLAVTELPERLLAAVSSGQLVVGIPKLAEVSRIKDRATRDKAIDDLIAGNLSIREIRARRSGGATEDPHSGAFVRATGIKARAIMGLATKISKFDPKEGGEIETGVRNALVALREKIDKILR